MPQTTIDGINDFLAGAHARPFWNHFAWEGIRARYRRSVTGLLWITLSTLFFVLAIGGLFGLVLEIRRAIFIPYLASAYITWILLNSLVLDGCKVFTSKKDFILSSALPLSVYLYEMVWSNIIKFAFALPVALIMIPVFKVPVSISAVLLLPGLLIIAINGIWIGTLLGLLCLRFHDMREIVSSLMRIVFFLTPILWQPSMLSERAYIANFNPFAHFLALVRDPLLGVPPSLTNYAVCLAVTVVGCGFAIWGFGRWRLAIPVML